MVDPVTLIVSALVAGAAAGMKENASTAVKDAYAALKRRVSERHPDVDLTAVERKPESVAKRGSLEEDLREQDAGGDEQLQQVALELIETVRSQDRGAATGVGIDLERIRAEFLTIRDVRAGSTGVRVSDAEFQGGIDIAGVSTVGEDSGHPF